MRRNRGKVRLVGALTWIGLVMGGCGWLPAAGSDDEHGTLGYRIVDTGQTRTYDASGEVSAPQRGRPFYGQDAQHVGNAPAYRDNGDGTVTDLVTGLIWQQAVSAKATASQAAAGALSCELAGYTDWRLPTIKELYSLIDFSGLDLSPQSTTGSTPFIDTEFLDFRYGDVTAGERIIDAQWVSSTTYAAGRLVFGVNFADGRIKGYGTAMPGGAEKTFFARYVRGTAYGANEFVDRGDGTVLDLATGLMWSKADAGRGMDWPSALAYVETLNDATYLGYSDWRLPNAKELQSIVDYGRSPDTTDSPALDPVFTATPMVNEGGETDWGFFWTSTTHASVRGGSSAVYVAFGRGLGYMDGRWVDVHGAGCQRSDPKTGSASQYPLGHGPQGDAVRIENFVRVVRDAF